MQISIQTNACVLSISDDSIHAKSIEHFISKNFKRVLSFANTRLIFTNKTESFKRSYFLQWAYQVYCKSNLPSNALEENLKTLQNIPIKIILTSKNKITKKLHMCVEMVEENKVILKIEEKNQQLSLYLQIRFAKAFVETLSDHHGIVIKIINKETLIKLKNLLSCSFLMGVPVQFSFPNGRIDNMRVDDQKNNAITDAFSTLKVQPGSSMQEIKENYRKLLKQYHPDRVFMCDAKIVSIYTEKFQSIQSAFELIKEKTA